MPRLLLFSLALPGVPGAAPPEIVAHRGASAAAVDGITTNRPAWLRRQLAGPR